MKRQTVFLTICVFALSVLALAQKDKSQRPSQPASAECKFAGGKTIKTDYSTPHVKDPKTGEVRKMLGGHEPYGQVWRTGANEATTFVTDTDLTVNGKDVPAGSYTIFTIPNPDKWTLLINKKTGEWGIPYKWEADELLRTDMKVEKLDTPLETFNITYHSHGSSCMMHLQWETTNVSVEFKEKK